MKLPQLASCCFFSLRTGAIAIGAFRLILSIYLACGFSVPIYWLSQGLQKSQLDKSEKDSKATVIGILSVFLLVTIFFMAVNIVLLIGVLMKKLSYVRFYILADFNLQIIYLLLTAFKLMFVFKGFTEQVLPSIFICISIYSFIVIYSYYQREKQLPISSHPIELL